MEYFAPVTERGAAEPQLSKYQSIPLKHIVSYQDNTLNNTHLIAGPGALAKHPLLKVLLYRSGDYGPMSTSRRSLQRALLLTAIHRSAARQRTHDRNAIK